MWRDAAAAAPCPADSAVVLMAMFAMLTLATWAKDGEGGVEGVGKRKRARCRIVGGT